MAERPARALRGLPVRTRQRGVALVTALLVVALAVTAAASLAVRSEVALARIDNAFASETAMQFALGAEAWARAILARDARSSDVDHLAEIWARPLPPIPVEDGTVRGRIEDLQGRFNVNNLAGEAGEVAGDVERFERLLERVGLDPRLADVVRDWVDADQERRPYGAEDPDYLGEGVGYRAANRPLVHASELAAMKGIGTRGWLALAPFVTALPGRTTVNLNTASAEILMALDPRIGRAQARQLIDGRRGGGYSDIGAFLAHPVFGDDPPVLSSVSVASDFFLITAQVELARGRAGIASVVERLPEGGTATVARSFSVVP